MTTICKNCNHHFEGNFCNNCGQSSQTPEVNFKFLVYEIQHSIFNVDKGFFYTIKELFYRPGITIRAYLDGKRVKHFKPIAFVLILSTTYAILTHYSNKTTFLEEIFSGISDGVNEKNTNTSFNLFIYTLQWMKNNYAYTTLLIIPVMSLASYLAFIKTKYNYFQHLILNSFIAGQRTVAFLLILPITYFITDKGAINFIDSLKVIIGILLTFWTYFQFFDTTKSLSKILLTVLTYIYLAGIFFILILLLFGMSKIWE
ncbi:MAG: DUF3667 domain-containing protein [Chitinophagales bacterium]|nr:DUF3667 domain-containing protein [Chitinophagales bacterium]